jgi:membrane associated rhomboid family serine protease
MLILSDDAESSNFPVITYFLIGLNALVFCWSMAACVSNGTEYFYAHYGTVPTRFLAQHDLTQYIAVLSAMFVHFGLMHFAGNMWALYLFGDNVEDRLGHFTFLVFYLSCGIAAELAHIYFNPSSALPSVGASGAIAGVMAAYLLFFPDAKCKVWWGDNLFFLAFKTYMIPSQLVIAGWFVLQVISATIISKVGGNGGIAYHAHVGGFIGGLTLALVFSGLKGMSGKDPETPAYSDRIANFGLIGACLSLVTVGVVAFYPAFHTGPAFASTPAPKPLIAKTPGTSKPAISKAPAKAKSTKPTTTHRVHHVHQTPTQ